MASKEMLIVFLYDAEACTKEDDDPLSALLFFAPSWVGENQKLSLVGQLMGTSHFFNDCFARPRSITLQNGKFALRYFGRYILAVGTDRNIIESTMMHRADLLSALLHLFHCDIEKISSSYMGETQKKNFTDKLYCIFETYLPLLQYNSNVFYNVSRLSLPKSASNVYLETMQVLESCQQETGVLGGQIMYHNKVIASQFSGDLGKLLVISDPLRLKTVELINVEFHVPFGVHLMTVYISSKEFNSLKKASEKAQTAFANTNSNLLPFTLKKKSTTTTKESTSLMKRDKSIIFSNIPEEESVPNGEATGGGGGGGRKQQQKVRPNHLPLKFKTSRDLPESGFSSINFDETDSYPDFIGKTSICSTPMTENKILHGNILSICANTCAEFENIDSKPSPPPKAKEPTKKTFELPMDAIHFVTNPYKAKKRRNSWGAFEKSIHKFAEKFKIKSNPGSDDEEELIKHSRSIGDPTFPVQTSTGEPLSRQLFEQFLEMQYTSMYEQRKPKPIKDAEVKKEEEEEAGPPKEDELKELPDVPKLKINKKALSLPLKSRSGEKSLFEESKKTRGLALTPLMAKLTVLALSEERAMDATPGSELAPLIKRRPSVTKPDEADEPVGELQRVDLFVCGQQNMTLIVALEEGHAKKAENVQQLFEVCVSRLTKIETNLHQVLNMNVDGGGDKGEGSYSFIAIDNKKWDLVEKVGPWSGQDLTSLESMHYEMKHNRNFTDMILRNEDSLLYGYQCGNVEMFYQQSHQSTAGLPPPSDVMGFVNSVSKRRLERDHSMILL